MREIKFKFYYKNKLIEAMSLREINKHRFHWANDVKVVEWTGLKDKNGVEIYEGDEVRWYTLDGYIGEETVEFRNGYFYPVGSKPLSWGTEYDEERGFEITGKIYENEDLLGI